jgi:tRNA U34 2-thiouridine synthase MnmA/TrmU
MKKKAISLMSGGLDSAVATRLVLEQQIEVTGLHFTSFFTSRKDRGKNLRALKTADELGIKLIILDKGPEYLDIVKHPKYGYGKNMNPCIDCRIFMLQKTKRLMDDEGARFVITGEVLGQRPMSQRRETMERIERDSGLEGLILRPLSAHHFPPTIPEQEGIVDRKQLLNISGRSRRIQYELVKKYGLKAFHNPGGGCLLTDPIFSKKMRDLLKKDPQFTTKDIELLTIGRHFRLGEKTKLILGRNKEENEILQNMWESGYTIVSPADFKGPQGMLKGPINEEIIKNVAHIIGYFAKHNERIIRITINNGHISLQEIKKTDIDPQAFMIEEEDS